MASRGTLRIEIGQHGLKLFVGQQPVVDGRQFLRFEGPYGVKLFQLVVHVHGGLSEVMGGCID